MKLRIHGNSLRLRLNGSEIEQLRNTGLWARDDLSLANILHFVTNPKPWLKNRWMKLPAQAVRAYMVAMAGSAVRSQPTSVLVLNFSRLSTPQPRQRIPATGMALKPELRLSSRFRGRTLLR